MTEQAQREFRRSESFVSFARRPQRPLTSGALDCLARNLPSRLCRRPGFSDRTPAPPRTWNMAIGGPGGDRHRAIAEYDWAIAVDPRHAVAYNNRGNARQASGDLEGADRDYSKALEIDPRLAVALNNRGNVRHARRDLDGAIEDYDTALSIDPDLADVYRNRASSRISRETSMALRRSRPSHCNLQALFVRSVRAATFATQASLSLTIRAA